MQTQSTNALQAFIQSKPMGFLTKTEIHELLKLDRLCPVLVRCGAVRFTCAVQDVETLIHCIEANGDYLRDVSIPKSSAKRSDLLNSLEIAATRLDQAMLKLQHATGDNCQSLADFIRADLQTIRLSIANAKGQQ